MGFVFAEGNFASDAQNRTDHWCNALDYLFGVPLVAFAKRPFMDLDESIVYRMNMASGENDMFGNDNSGGEHKSKKDLQKKDMMRCQRLKNHQWKLPNSSMDEPMLGHMWKSTFGEVHWMRLHHEKSRLLDSVSEIAYNYPILPNCVNESPV